MAGKDGEGQANAVGHELTLAARTAEVLVGAEAVAPRPKKFVQVEVAQVVNPRRIPLSFTVHYRPAAGDALLLGTFSLFPPDNPGTFIVATQGKLQPGGTVTVALAPLVETGGDADVRVQVRRISFVDE
jgi:hypothetical protein